MSRIVHWTASHSNLGERPVSSQTIVILPLGAQEQHGPHLPLETDTLIARGVCKALEEELHSLDRMQMADVDDVRILPVEPIGYSPEHMDFEGSKTLSYEAALGRWISIGEQLSALGVRRFLLLNAHGGNSPLVSLVCQELRVRCNMLAVGTKWDRFIDEIEVGRTERIYGIHAGRIETSVMLWIAPEDVQMKQALDYPSLQQTLNENFRHLQAYGPHAFGWKMQDLNSSGVTGMASRATAEEGGKLVHRAAVGLCELLHDMLDFRLSWLK